MLMESVNMKKVSCRDNETLFIISKEANPSVCVLIIFINMDYNLLNETSVSQEKNTV
jgi:hypothetical protein